MNRMFEAFKIKPGEERIALLLVGLMYVMLGLFSFVTSTGITALMGRRPCSGAGCRWGNVALSESGETPPAPLPTSNSTKKLFQ